MTVDGSAPVRADPVGAVGAALLVASVALASCTTPDEAAWRYSPRAPADAEARALLAEAVRLAEAGDDAALCHLTIAELGCTTALANSGPVPAGDPEVVASRVHEERRQGDTGMPAARVLGVCVGDVYSEVAVLRTSSGDLEFVNPVYWTGFDYVDPGAEAVIGDGVVEVPLGPGRAHPDC